MKSVANATAIATTPSTTARRVKADAWRGGRDERLRAERLGLGFWFWFAVCIVGLPPSIVRRLEGSKR